MNMSLTVIALASVLASAPSFAADVVNTAVPSGHIVTLETVQVRPSLAQQAEAAMRPIIDLAVVQVRPHPALVAGPAFVQQVMHEPITSTAYHAGQVLLPYLELPYSRMLYTPAVMLGGKH